LARHILISAMRMSVQLMILGMVLRQIFSMAHPLPVMLLAVAMTIIAGISAVRRIDRRFPGIYGRSILSVWASSWLAASVAVLLVVGNDPWYSPQVAIPLIGMVLGNSLTGVSLGLDRFLDEIVRRRDEVEMYLSLGATRWESVREIRGVAARTAMIPILNTMSVTGVVSLPGMMTGQLLAGASPTRAVQYQIVIMFVIAAAIAMGVVLALSFAFHRISTPAHQIAWDRIQDRGNKGRP
jgi:putative ABC transport system permease protein